VYPAEAARAGLTGIVILEALISTTGNVMDVRVAAGASPLTQAVDAVKQRLYETTFLDGVPVEVVTTITVSFPN
jgi:TonB family protein